MLSPPLSDFAPVSKTIAQQQRWRLVHDTRGGGEGEERESREGWRVRRGEEGLHE